ncbi:MAG TPA: TetR/AcrR family transcriptional regulator [Acidimicrobiales bacterium]|nr:TetR/AcrR family transcriptional regulator [Acidimicrobiales bacterium]
MASTRRIGKETSKTRALLLDATERLMLEEGYAAVSSRRVAAAADVKPALVHYYFPTMDDLFVALFRRGAERNMERITGAAESEQPLRALWQLSNEQRGAVLMTEFTALSRHRTAVRSEIAAFGRRFRKLQLRAIGRTLDRHGIDGSVVTAEAVAVLMTGLSTTLTLEREVGMSTGHTQAVALVEHLLHRYEPAPEPADARQGLP